MKTNTTNKPGTIFEATSAIINGITMPAKYSLGTNGHVYVFTGAKLSPDSPVVAIRANITPDMPMYASALAAAKAAEAAKAEQPKTEQTAKVAKADTDASVKADAPKAKPAKVAKAEPAKVAEQPVKIAKAAAKVQAAKADTKAGVKADAPKAKPAKTEKQPKAAKVAEQPKAEQTPAKAWIGTDIAGKGWKIAFDADAQRTRVVFESEPTPAQRSAVEAAKFFWSPSMSSFNKKLTVKAYRAAQELAAALNAIA